MEKEYVTVKEMDKKLVAMVTDVGNELIASATVRGEKVKITDFAVGDGGGSYYRPDSAMTDLKNEVWRGKVNSFEVLKGKKNIFVITAVCPATAGGFTIREMGVYDEAGNLFAICNTPDTPKVLVTDGAINELRLQLEVAIINPESVELMIDPNIVTATKDDIEQIWEHLGEVGRVFVGTEDSELNDNDICIVVDKIPWPQDTEVYTYTEEGTKATVATGDGKPILIR